MLNTKADYFALSRQQGLPSRCPLLGRCERRAHTIALANDWQLGDAAARLEMKEPLVLSVGEPAYLAGGENNFILSGQCPEVGLFDSSMAIIGLSGAPVTKGRYDKYMDPQHKILETGHFSECAEYVHSRHETSLPVTEATSLLKNLAPPEKITLKWLFDHVPISLWFGAGTLLFATFLLGLQASQAQLVRDILLIQPASEQSNAFSAKPDKGRQISEQAPAKQD